MGRGRSRKARAALKHWKKVEREARGGGISFFEGMRLLSGRDHSTATRAADVPEAAANGRASPPGAVARSRRLAELRDPGALGRRRRRRTCVAELRPYQQTGVSWLRFMTRLGLGACLADDMGLGKTIQVIALLLHVKAAKRRHAATGDESQPAGRARVADRQLEIGNRAFRAVAFGLRSLIPSDVGGAIGRSRRRAGRGRPHDLVITTYGMLSRLAWAARAAMEPGDPRRGAGDQEFRHAPDAGR